VTGEELYDASDDDDEPVDYMVDIMPKIARRYSGDVTAYEVVQEEGDTVFIPSKWWW